MKKLILGGVAALVLTLGIAAPQASAAWATRPVTYWDASCGQYVTTTQTYWVPDPVVRVPVRGHVEFRGHDFRHHEEYRGHRR
jgi:hypothetical protein